jgi:pimeloyl-ACP methyl ester carboxylesterase
MNIGLRTLSPHLHVLYPTEAPPKPERIGIYDLDVARDAPMPADLPHVVISHGTGGTPWAYRGLAMHLAREGFAVALVEHVGNSRSDNSLADTPELLAKRPQQIREAIDALGVSEAALIGHSMGGYTALAIAGGKPLALPNQTSDGKAHPVDVTPDSRVTKIVLLAPAVPWFMAPGSLDAVRVPVMTRVGQRDTFAPPAFVETVLTIAMDFAVVPNAGHFAFFYPVPAALAGMMPAEDPPGFDRAAYQPQLYAEVTAFLKLDR